MSDTSGKAPFERQFEGSEGTSLVSVRGEGARGRGRAVSELGSSIPFALWKTGKEARWLETGGGGGADTRGPAVRGPGFIHWCACANHPRVCEQVSDIMDFLTRITVGWRRDWVVRAGARPPGLWVLQEFRKEMVSWRSAVSVRGGVTGGRNLEGK